MPEKSADTQKNVASELFAQSVTLVKNEAYLVFTSNSQVVL